MESSTLTSSTSPSSPQRRPLLRSFAVFSPSLSRNREDRAEDNVLFYYPLSDHKNRQLNHVGFCIAVSCLCDRFSGTAPLRRPDRTGPRTREHEIQCRDRLIALSNPYDDLWLAAELSTPLAADRSTVQLALCRCFDLFYVLYGRATLAALLVPPTVDSAVAARGRAALQPHCTAFIAYLTARLAAAETAIVPHLTLTAPVLDVTRCATTASMMAMTQGRPARLAVVSELAKERLHNIVEESVRRFHESVAPQTVDFDVARAERAGQTSWETLAERTRTLPNTPASFAALPRRERRRQEACTRALWAVLCETRYEAVDSLSATTTTTTTTTTASTLSRSYTLAVASDTFPRRLLALVTTYLDVYGVPAPGDVVPCYLLSTGGANGGPSHSLVAAQCGGVVLLCVVPVAAMDGAESRWAAWLARTARAAGLYVLDDARSAGGTAADDAQLVLHGTDVSENELRCLRRNSGGTPERLPFPVRGDYPQRPGSPIGSWLLHGQSIVRGASPRVLPPMVWRTIVRLLGYVRDKKASSSVSSPPPESLWLPCGAYWLSLAVATTDPDCTNGDVLVTAFQASQRLEQCFSYAHELHASLLF